MIISFKHKFIFVKSRKTGGTSVQVALSEFCGPDDIITGAIKREDGTIEENYGKGQNTDKFFTDHPHPTVEQIKDWLEQKGYNWEDFYSFTVMRNPFDLIVSRYHWDVAGKGKQETSIENFRYWIVDYLKSGRYKTDLQRQYVKDNRDNQFVSSVYYYESLDLGFELILEKLGLPKTSLNFNLKSGYRDKSIHFGEYYTKGLVELVLDYFSEDFLGTSYKKTPHKKFYCDLDAYANRCVVIPDDWDDNTNGPCIIQVPEWIKNPLGKYYLYYAHHQGKYIRMAYSDDPLGPFKPYEGGVLDVDKTPCKNHIASPEIIVDDKKQEINMIFHGDYQGEQPSFIANSIDGVNFDVEYPEPYLNTFYFRYFEINGQGYGISKKGNDCGVIWKYDKQYEWVPYIHLIENIRHASTYVDGNMLYVFYSKIGDNPEHIRICTINTIDWEVLDDVEFLTPTHIWEGIEKNGKPSKPGAVYGLHKQLRDPYLFKDIRGRLYLYYAAGGEYCVGVVPINFR